MMNYTYKLAVILLAFVFGGLMQSHEVLGQACPDKTKSQNTIAVKEACYGEEDGTITISFVNASGSYDPAAAAFDPIADNYKYGLFQSGVGYVYDKGNRDPGFDINPNITLTYTAPNTITFSNLPAVDAIDGYYIVIRCQSTDRQLTNGGANGIVVAENDEIKINKAQVIITDNTRCDGTFDGEINLETAISGGTSPYTYSKDGGTNYQPSSVFSNLEPGSYPIVIKDAINCIKDTTITIGQIPPPSISINANQSVCVDTDLMLNPTVSGGTAPYPTNLWTGDTGPLDNPNTQMPTFNTNTVGTYNLVYTVTDGHGCSASTSITIAVGQDNADFTYPDGGTFCQSYAGTVVPQTFTAGIFSATPTPGLFFVDANTGEIDPSQSAPGIYNVTYTTTSACPNTITKQITIYAAPTVYDQTPEVCEDAIGSGKNTVNLENLNTLVDGGTGLTIAWYTDAAATTPVATPTSVEVMNGQKFYAKATDGNSCFSVAEVTYTVNLLPSDISNARAENIQCMSFEAHWDVAADATGYVIDLISGGTVINTETVTATSKNFTGLTQGAPYAFQVRATNACGDGNTTAPVNVQLLGIPATPTGLNTSNIGCTSFDVSWSAVTGANNYILKVYSDATLTNELVALSQTVAAPAVNTSLSGLTNNTTYYFTIAASNTCGTSAPSPAQNAITTNVPEDPSGLNASNIICTSFQANWTAATDAVDYTVKLIEEGGDFNAPLATQTINAPNVSATFNALTAGTNYQFSVTANNTCGSSTAIVSAIVSTPAKPAIPTNLAATNPTCTEFTINWDNIPNADSYTVELYTDLGLTNLQSPPQSVSNNTITYNTLTANTTYYAQVKAVNDCGESNFSATLAASTSNLPTAPANPQINNILCTSLTVNWNVGTGAESYEIQLDKEGDFALPEDTYTVSHPTNSHTFSGLDPATSYTFRVRAVNACGESSYVVSAPATTRALPAADTAPVTVCEDVFGTDVATFNLTTLNGSLDNGGAYTITWYHNYDGNTVSNPVANATSKSITNAEVVYALVDDGTCQNVATRNFTVNPKDDPSFDYPQASYCKDGIDPSPTNVATPGGTFTAGTGLSIDANTGEITLSSSTVGNYVVTYTTPTTGSCPSSTTFNIQILAAQDASFSYAPNTFCQGDAAPTLTVATTGGNFSAEAGLTIDAATGAINPAGSQSGNYTVRYSLPGACPATTTFAITVNGTPDASFSYGSGTFCQDDTNPTPTTATPNGTFTASSTNLKFTGVNPGEIDLSGSFSGSYTVTYSLVNGTCSSSQTIPVTINTSTADATFSYEFAEYCKNNTTNPAPVFATGASAGTFTVDNTNLKINPSTGVIDLANSMSGDYVITNTIAASGSCPESVATTNIKINAVPDATFSYGGTQFCINQSNPVSDKTGGTYANAEGLVDAVTGEFDLSGAIVGTTYTITYTVTDATTTCESTTSSSIKINAADDATFSYGGVTEFCQNENVPAPTVTTGGGAFAADNGLVINTDDGSIVSGQAAGSYRVTYTTGGSCASSLFVDITINAVPIVPATISEDVCEDTQGISTASINLADQHPTIDPSSSYTIQWYPNASLNAAEEINTLNVTTANNQKFYAKVSDANSCFSITILTYRVGSLPILTDVSKDLCEDNPGNGSSTVDLTSYEVEIGTGYTYTWYEDAGLSIAVATPTNVTVNNGDKFYAKANNGCEASAQIDFTINTKPVVSFTGLNSPYCAGDPTVTLTGNQAGGTFTGTGVTDNGDGTASFTPSVSGTITITYGFTANGCTETVSQSVVVNNCTGGVAANFIADQTAICDGQTVKFTDQSSGATGWSWNFGANATPATATGKGPHVVTYNGSGFSTVSLTVDNGAGDSDTKAATNYIMVNAYKDATFSYGGVTTFCQGATTPVATAIITPNGIFTANNGLPIDATTGEIDLNAAVQGNYTITYTTNTGTCDTSFDLAITIEEAPNAFFEYAANTFCQSEANPAAINVAVSGGNFSNTQGLIVDAADGTIDLSSATPGTLYTIEYSVTQNSCESIHSFTVTIKEAPIASFTYGTGTFCKSGTNPTPQPGFTPLGTFSTDAPANLSVDADNGTIDLAASNINTGGPYKVYYTVSNGSCVSKDSVMITITNAPDATFKYSKETYCQGEANPSPTPDAPGASFGTFSATPRDGGTGVLVIDGATGEIDLAASDPGMYNVTNYIAACNTASYSTFVEIITQENAAISYGNTTYCQNETANPVATITGMTNGTFSATPAGLEFVNTNTGEINLAASAPNIAYTIQYVTSANVCADTATFNVTINPADDASFSYDAVEYCKNGPAPVLTSTVLPGSTFFATPSGLSINSTTGAIDLNASDAKVYDVTYRTNGSCSKDSTIRITIYEEPVANAGGDGSSCTLEHTLNATAPATGTGEWRVITTPSGATASFDDATSNNATITVSEAGVYRLRWEVANGLCIDAEEIDVTFAEPLKIEREDIAPGDEIFYVGNCNPSAPYGIVPIKISGGSDLYDVLWSNGTGATNVTSTSSSATTFEEPEDLHGTPSNPTKGVKSGVYTVVVTDKNTGCAERGIFLVKVETDPAYNPSLFGNNLALTGSISTCHGTGGEITFHIEETGPYNIYYISENIDTVHVSENVGSGLYEETISVPTGGKYYVHVEDLGEGCSVGDTVRINEPTPIVFNLVSASDSVSCYGGDDASIDIDVSGGTPLAGGPPNYNYQWYKDGSILTGVTTEDPLAGTLTAGNYYLEVTDDNDCPATSPIITIKDAAPIPAPTANAATLVGCSEFTASWSDEGVSDYQLEVADDPAFGNIIFNPTITGGNTSQTVSGLAEGITYYYRVRAVTASCGPTVNSNEVAVTTKATEATTLQPVNGITCDAFTVRWNPVTDANQYFVDIAEDAGFTTILPAYNNVPVPSTSNSLNITGLNAGQEYFYRVQVDHLCGSPSGYAESSVTLVGAPAKPVVLLADNPTCDGFDIEWSPVAGVNSYTVQVDDASFAGTPDFERTINTNSITVAGLPAPGTYAYRIIANGAGSCGNSAPSDPASFDTQRIPAAAPVSATPSDATCTGFTLAWEAVADADRYLVEVEDALANITSLTVTGVDTTFTTLTQATDYNYRITAENSCGLATTWATGSYTTDDLPVVPNVTAPNASCNGFDITWDVIANATEYVVEVTNQTTSYVWTSTVNTNTFTADTLRENTPYAVRVQAKSTCDYGSFSSSQTFTTLPEAQCGCGHDKARFVINPVNVNCVGGKDGALMVNLLPKSGVSVAASRFEYKYRSLTNVADSSDWEDGYNTFGLTWVFDDLSAGNYQLLIKDKNAQAGCQEILTLERTIAVQNNITFITRAATCAGADGGITLNVPSSCSATTTYEFLWINMTDPGNQPNPGNGGKEASDLNAGEYQIIVRDDLGTAYDTLFATVNDNCSNNGGGGGEPAIICELGNNKVVRYTTEVGCETGKGTITLTVDGGESGDYTFAVKNQATNEQLIEDAVAGSFTFEDLALGKYYYQVIDKNSDEECTSAFTIAPKAPVISSADFILPACDAPAQVATLEVVMSAESASFAPAPYDVQAMRNGEVVSSGVIEAGASSVVLTDLPTGADYKLIVQSRAEGTCAAKLVRNIPQTGKTDITFDIAPGDITCFGDGGTVTVSNLVVGENEPFTLNLYRTDEQTPYMTKIFQVRPSMYMFTNLETGEYQVQAVQQQTTCGNQTSTKRSEVFSIEGPERELTAIFTERVEVSVNDPIGDIAIGKIQGGGFPYRVRIAADPFGNASDWQEVTNANPAINDYEYTFANKPMGIYIIQLEDKFGCMLTSTVEVRYTEELYIPNIITPNGDGQNDTFRIINLPLGSDGSGAKMIISNRWGRIIYRSNNYTNENAWDGEDYPDGVYYYNLQILGESSSHTGWLEIWRGRTP